MCTVRLSHPLSCHQYVLPHVLILFFKFDFAEISSFLLFATKKDVRRLSLDSTELADVVISLSNVSSAIGVEYDSDTDSIYWSDLDADIIGHATWNGSTEEVVYSVYFWKRFFSFCDVTWVQVLSHEMRELHKFLGGLTA